MSVVKPAKSDDFNPDELDGEKHVCHRRHETKEVWQVLCEWAGTNERRWQMLVVMALLESAEWTQEMVSMGLRLTRGRIGQIAVEAKRELPRAFEPSPKDLAGAA